ncbi:PREDICTED: uncharacterized protein LOC107187062 [Dufourea novaeangliae]|uniref:Dopamine N-acetyltransferase n=1 Tax=Dufourea novaeangliae TaxID=178035 RepID=A0A154PAI3_DUFNO|nr:PREDICTED: uncharacterized protein LOC107187062 [Dufourea novaeangliae]KZC08851.1 Dopamine N-acetyltransferase [Dufourea novaeangliae]
MGSNDIYMIEWAKPSDLSEILSFLRENFDKEETVLNSIKNNNSLTEDDLNEMWNDHERLIKTIFEFSPCLLALDKSTKKIIGANLMIVSRNLKSNDRPGGVDEVFNDNPPVTKLMKQYFDCFSEIEEKAELHLNFPNANAAVEFYAVAVDRNYRKMGIATGLMKEGVTFARNTFQDSGFVFGICTSIFSKKAIQKVGLESVFEVDLLEYKDDSGRPIYQDTAPHNTVSLMALEL